MGVGLEGEDAKEMGRVLGEKTAGVGVSDLVGVVREGVRLGRMRWMEEEAQRKAAMHHRAHTLSPSPLLLIPSLLTTSHPLILAPFALTLPDLTAALTTFTARTASQSGTLASTPTTRWSDIGGLDSAKREIHDIIHLPLLHPTLFTSSSSSPFTTKRRGGLLLYGPPGTGKTLLAKAVACESGLNFISVKGPELLNMYVGESERNVREVFARARGCRPCVLFFDELDSLAPRRGGGSDGGGVMDRVVSQLLTEMDDLSTASQAPSESIFVIGATNRPDLLDSALLRPGRLDRAVYLGVGEGVEGRLSILRALTRKLRLQGGGEWLREVVEGMEGRGFTGADCYGLVMDALMIGVKRRIEEVKGKVAELNALHRAIYRDADGGSAEEERRGEEWGEEEEEDEEVVEVTPLSYLRGLQEEQLEVEVTRLDFLEALQRLTPSLSREELEHYEALRKRFSKQSTAVEGATGTEQQQKGLGAAKVGGRGRKEERAEDGVGGGVLALPRLAASMGKEEREERKEDVAAPLSQAAHTNGHDRGASRRGSARRGR